MSPGGSWRISPTPSPERLVRNDLDDRVREVRLVLLPQVVADLRLCVIQGRHLGDVLVTPEPLALDVEIPAIAICPFHGAHHETPMGRRMSLG